MVRFRFSTLAGLGLVLLSFSLGTTLRQASANQILVPAYANPCCADGPAMWSSLIAVAQQGIPLHVILNPASGPGALAVIDPNYVNVGPSGPLLDLYNVGAKIYGYVATTFGNRPINDVKNDIDKYYDPAFYLNSGIALDGIFLDEMSNDLAKVGYYQSIRQHILGLNANARIFGNPGTSFVNDSSFGASGFDVNDYAATVDTMITFENTEAEYRTNYFKPSWQVGGDESRFGHIVHTAPSPYDVFGNIKRAHDRGAGFLYLTDDILPNPFDRLPGYWTSFQLGILQLGLFDTNKNHYKCYDVKKRAKLAIDPVDLVDQFGEDLDVKVKKPAFFCNPVDKNGEGIVNKEAHLTCYKIKSKQPKRTIEIENQFGGQTLVIGNSKLLCVPTQQLSAEEGNHRD